MDVEKQVRRVGAFEDHDGASQRGACQVRRSQPRLPRASHLHHRPCATSLAGRRPEPSYPLFGALMSDLTLAEMNHVRVALRFLHRCIGTWAALADGL